ncbi:type 1 glutamine amidotransferase domain-containing protein, partial [Pectobacterium polaris]|nr:type 1 glutamine amidotransferase domain-containing protein [Pectobacterium polaris]
MSIIKRCAGLIAAMAVFATASPVFAQANLKEEKVLIVVSSLDKKTPDLVGGF